MDQQDLEPQRLEEDENAPSSRPPAITKEMMISNYFSPTDSPSNERTLIQPGTFPIFVPPDVHDSHYFAQRQTTTSTSPTITWSDMSVRSVYSPSVGSINEHRSLPDSIHEEFDSQQPQQPFLEEERQAETFDLMASTILFDSTTFSTSFQNNNNDEDSIFAPSPAPITSSIHSTTSVISIGDFVDRVLSPTSPMAANAQSQHSSSSFFPIPRSKTPDIHNLSIASGSENHQNHQLSHLQSPLPTTTIATAAAAANAEPSPSTSSASGVPSAPQPASSRARVATGAPVDVMKWVKAENQKLLVAQQDLFGRRLYFNPSQSFMIKR